MKWTAECTWGSGPDIVMSSKNKDGNATISADLTVAEAEDLVNDLLASIAMCRQLEALCEAHDKQMAKEKKDAILQTSE
jgi:hypothetical protein